MTTNPDIIAVENELHEAMLKFPPMRSPHEGLAIIQEEVFELQIEVYKQHDCRHPSNMRHEAMQIAAMAIRFMMDCGK